MVPLSCLYLVLDAYLPTPSFFSFHTHILSHFPTHSRRLPHIPVFEIGYPLILTSALQGCLCCYGFVSVRLSSASLLLSPSPPPFRIRPSQLATRLPHSQTSPFGRGLPHINITRCATCIKICVVLCRALRRSASSCVIPCVKACVASPCAVFTVPVTSHSEYVWNERGPELVSGDPLPSGCGFKRCNMCAKDLRNCRNTRSVGNCSSGSSKLFIHVLGWTHTTWERRLRRMTDGRENPSKRNLRPRQAGQDRRAELNIQFL